MSLIKLTNHIIFILLGTDVEHSLRRSEPEDVEYSINYIMLNKLFFSNFANLVVGYKIDVH